MSISKPSQRPTSLKSSGGPSKQRLLWTQTLEQQVDWPAERWLSVALERLLPLERRLDLTTKQEERLTEAIRGAQKKKLAYMISKNTPSDQWESSLLAEGVDVEGDTMKLFDDEEHVEYIKAISGQ